MKLLATTRHRSQPLVLLCLAFVACLVSAQITSAQDREIADEVVANLAGGRVIIHVARDKIVFAAIDQPVEANSIPPRVLSIDRDHIGVLLGASEWHLTIDPKPVRMDRDFPHVPGKNPHYAADPDEVAPDLDVIGVAFLERLRPLVSQLHHKLEFKPDEALFEVVLIGFAPNDYGPEVWTIEYHIHQEEIATRGDYWQTRLLRPRFTQLYPPEKKAPKTLVEVRYPDTVPGPTLQQLIEGNDPDIESLSKHDPKFLKVMESIDHGQANKAVTEDATDFMRAVVPLISEKAKFILGTIGETGGFDWVVPPDEPVEKAKEDKNAPPDAPTLHRRVKPN
ncbi:MAG TPA: hypothetical protein VGI46_17260 [Candidatus Acidoferrum sp.]|jgi:hypothetical protein